MSLATMAAPATRELDQLLRDVSALARRLDRDDLVTRLADVQSRAARSDTVVCVVGEFKKGKSALVNAILGAAICSVDDDLATTAVTVVRFGDEPSATVHRRVNGEPTIESIELGALAEWTVEQAGGELRRDIDMIDVRLPNQVLEGGLTLVDTPGVGGLNAGHAAATLAFLPSADALIFVTDTSAELSAPELEFLASARSAGAPLLIAATKVDIYPEWRRILDLDSRHLQAIGLVERPFPLSSTVRLVSDAHDDESGYGAFTEMLLGDVVERARLAAQASAVGDVRWVLGQLVEPLLVEREGLARPEDAGRIAAEVAAVRERLATLRRADAAWSRHLDDEFATVRTRVAFEFQREIRSILRDAHAEIDATDPTTAWPELSARVQGQIAAAVRGAFRGATTGAAGVQATIAMMLAEEDAAEPGTTPAMGFDIDEFWVGDPEFEGRTRSRLGSGYGLVTGAKAGVELLGIVGTLLGAAIVGPAVLGVAAIYGGKEVLDERRRRLVDRRQRARTFLGELIEEIRFQVDGRLTGLFDEMQRQMRVRFHDRVAELQRTAAAAAASLERAGRKEASARRTRQLDTAIEEIAALRERVMALRPGS